MPKKGNLSQLTTIFSLIFKEVLILTLHAVFLFTFPKTKKRPNKEVNLKNHSVMRALTNKQIIIMTE